MSTTPQLVQVFGRKKTSTAVASCRAGKGLIKINGVPISLVEPQSLRVKVMEPIYLLEDTTTFRDVDIRVRVKGGGQVSQIYAIRQAISKSIIAYYGKYQDEVTKMNIKDKFVSYDRSLVVADPRRSEAKKFGGPGPRAKYQKSYR